MSRKSFAPYRAAQDFLLPISSQCYALYEEIIPLRVKLATTMAFKNGVIAGLGYQMHGKPMPQLYAPGSYDDTEFRTGAYAGARKARDQSLPLEVAA